MAPLTNPIVGITFAVVGTLLLGTLGYFLWRYGRRDASGVGHRKGKKIMEAALPKWVDALNNKSQEKPFDDALKEICGRVFDVGFAFERAGHEATIKDIDFQIKRIEDEIRAREETLIKGYKSELDTLNSRALMQKKKIEQLEEEHVKTQKEGARTIQNIQEKGDKKPYFFSRLANGAREKLRISGKNFEADILRYGYVCVIALLFAGDYYITYSIFSDILITVRNSWMIYIASGVIALVFLILVDLFLEFLDRQSMENATILEHTHQYSWIIIGAILLIAYMLIISVSLFPESSGARVIDAILRILFLPLIFAAALMIQRVKKEYGFSFLLAPVRFVVFGTGLIFSYAALPFEAVIKKIYEYYRSKRTLAPVKHNLLDFLNAEKGNMSFLENAISTLEQKILYSGSRLESEISKTVSPLKEQKDATIAHFTALRRGCDEAVLDQLKQAQEHA